MMMTASNAASSWKAWLESPWRMDKWCYMRILNQQRLPTTKNTKATAGTLSDTVESIIMESMDSTMENMTMEITMETIIEAVMENTMETILEDTTMETIAPCEKIVSRLADTIK